MEEADLSIWGAHIVGTMEEVLRAQVLGGGGGGGVCLVARKRRKNTHSLTHPPTTSVQGFTGARVLNSPSIFYVWSPSSSSSPPHTNQPALYRIPFYGGIPEVVTLHAPLCSQISVVGLFLYCLDVNDQFSRFALSRPNSAFLPLDWGLNASGFVVSREFVVYVRSVIIMSAGGLVVLFCFVFHICPLDSHSHVLIVVCIVVTIWGNLLPFLMIGQVHGLSLYTM